MLIKCDVAKKGDFPFLPTSIHYAICQFILDKLINGIDFDIYILHVFCKAIMYAAN